MPMKKRYCLFLCLALCISCLQVGLIMPRAQAADSGTSATHRANTNLIPHRVQQITKSEQITKKSKPCNTLEEATSYLRTQMTLRNPLISIQFPVSEKTSDFSLATELFNQAVAHTGVETQGDYIKWQCSGFNCDILKTSSSVTYTYTIGYFSNKEQEEAVDAAILELEKELAITSDMEDYEKYCILYNWLTQTVSYASDTADELMHTAYAALLEHTAVCQGYATLLYRLLLHYGVDNRILVSDTHAWNLIGIDGLYYESDATWDAQSDAAWNYSLKSSLSGSEHAWVTKEMDNALLSLPKASKDYIFHIESAIDLSKAGAFVLLTSPTLYAEYDAGELSILGYCKEKPGITVFDISNGDLSSLLSPLKEGQDFQVETSKTSSSYVIRILGINRYKGILTIKLPQALKAPTLTATKKSKTITLKWKKIPNAKQYVVYRKKKGGQWTKLATTSSCSYIDKNLQKGTYSYRVKATYLTQSSGYSKTKTFTVR